MAEDKKIIQIVKNSLKNLFFQILINLKINEKVMRDLLVKVNGMGLEN